jgi:putative ABC transport system substrate-binding protein
LAPDVARVALLWDPSSRSQQLQLRDLPAAAAAVGVKVTTVEIRRPDEVATALGAIRNSVDGLMVIGNPVTFKKRKVIAEFAVESRLPSVFEQRLFVETGGLLSYGPSFADLFRRAAVYVDKILKGAKPADLPIEQPTKFELVINRKTADTLGLSVPPSLLLRADQIVD